MTKVLLRIQDNIEMFFINFGDDEVINDASCVIEHHRKRSSSVRQCFSVEDGNPFQELTRIRPLYLYLSHVRNIENTCMSSSV